METSSREAVLAALGNLRLRGFDWDGALGLPLRGDVADTVHDLYTEPIISDAMDLGLPVPEITLSAAGTIEVTYAEGGRELLLNFECQGVITYIKAFEDKQTTVEGVIRLDPMEESCPADFDELLELIAWLIEE